MIRRINCVKIQDYMKNTPFLVGILGELPEELLNTISIRSYEAGETVIPRCEECKDSYIVLEGVCCSTSNFINGERGWFRKKTVGDVFGLLGILEHEYPFRATIFAKTKCVMARIPHDTMLRCFGVYPAFTKEIAKKVVNRLNHEMWRVTECNSYPPYIGVVTYLIYAYEFYSQSYPEGYEGPVKIIEKQTEIAHYVCMNVRTLQRILPVIRDEGLISMRSNGIYITREHYEKLKNRKNDFFR